MENLESSSSKKCIVLETYENINKSYSVKSDSREAMAQLYNYVADNYTILQYGVNYPNKYSKNQLENLSKDELDQIGALFKIGMIDENKFGTPTSGEYYENKRLRRDMTKKEKLLFLSYLNRIYGYRGRYDLISIFFLERHAEEERDFLLQELVKSNKEYVEERAKLIEKKLA